MAAAQLAVAVDRRFAPAAEPPKSLYGPDEMTEQLVQVRGARIWVHIAGSGDPPVVIEPGFMGQARDWSDVAESVKGDTTVMRYDRAGHGRSTRTAGSRTSREIAQDLAGVLDAVGLGRPCVFVGHSMGGIHIRAFASLYPSRVAGMVLVDSSHEMQRQVRAGQHGRFRLAWLWARPLLEIAGSPRRMRGATDRLTLLKELTAFRELQAGARFLGPGELRSKPLVVLTQGRAEDRRGMSAWTQLQADLALLSLNSAHVLSRTGHDIHLEGAETVAQAIAAVVRSVRHNNAGVTVPGVPTVKLGDV